MKSLKLFLTLTVGLLVVCQLPVAVAADVCDYRVVKVPADDMLWIRFGPHLKYQIVGAIESNGTKIQFTGPDIQIGKSRWVPIKYKDIEGWVNRGYLKKDCQLRAMAADESNYHTVDFRETLFSLSQRYKHSVKEIAKWNQLQPPYSLFVGQRLRISPPSPCYYRVVKVPANDVLWIRSKPIVKSQRVGAILHNGTEIIITGAELDIKKSRWVPVKYKGIEGWVNRAFLEKDC